MANGEEKRDLLNLFNENKRKFIEIEEENVEGIELTLGLSLNGRFGVDPSRNDDPGIIRSASVSNLPVSGGGSGGGSGAEASVPVAGLGRTLSMPSVPEEEVRKRKEAMLLRRMEAKRKRVVKVMSEKIRKGSGSHGYGPMGERYVVIGENGSGSSGGLSRTEAKAIIRGPNVPAETGSPISVRSHPQPVTIGAAQTTKPPAAKPTNNDAKDMMKNVTGDMPYVSTTGVGPRGKKIDGFLYRYRKGEEVRIVCVCHGSFLSPAEFVKHAGGGDVSQPLKHITVNPSPLL